MCEEPQAGNSRKALVSYELLISAKRITRGNELTARTLRRFACASNVRMARGRGWVLRFRAPLEKQSAGIGLKGGFGKRFAFGFPRSVPNGI